VGTIIGRKSGDQQSKYKLFKKGSAPKSGPGSIVGIATGYGLDSPGIKSRWGRDFPHLSRPHSMQQKLYCSAASIQIAYTSQYETFEVAVGQLFFVNMYLYLIHIFMLDTILSQW
jgi:hypothetical protein